MQQWRASMGTLSAYVGSRTQTLSAVLDYIRVPVCIYCIEH